MPSLPRLRAVLSLAFALSAALSAALMSSPGIALADCMAPPPVDVAVKSADIVFVGTVTEVANGNRWATVSVDEIWAGPDLPNPLLIKGGPDANTATSVDRSFEVGVRYLFFPYVDNGGEAAPLQAAGLSDNSCTSTQPMTDEITTLRPADARLGSVSNEGEARAFDFGPLLSIGGFVLVVVTIMLGVGLLARGRSD